MSRVIKFRAWNGTKMMYQKDGFGIYRLEQILDDDFHEPMQFTGLLDANGVEIYESDVIKGLLVDKRGERFEFTGSVFYQEYEFCIETDLHSWPVAAWHCVEKPAVVGNLYQNPELLK